MLDEDNGGLMRMEYEYRTAGAAAHRALEDATRATNTLKTMKCCLAQITPKIKIMSQARVSRSSPSPREMPAELAQKNRNRN